MNNKQAQKEILKIIKEAGGETSIEDIGIKTGSPALSMLLQPYEIDIYGYNLNLLFDKKKIVRLKYRKDFVRLTHLGEQAFDPFYKKIWKFLMSDFAKVLSIIAIILSIISMIISLIK